MLTLNELDQIMRDCEHGSRIWKICDAAARRYRMGLAAPLDEECKHSKFSESGESVVCDNCQPKIEEEWRRTVIDALVVNEIYSKEHDSDPRKALNDLIYWEQKIALDPAVSKEAQTLSDLEERAKHTLTLQDDPTADTVSFWRARACYFAEEILRRSPRSSRR